METVCIGCGCSDFRACEEGCSWLRNDTLTLLGVCSGCAGHVYRFDAGDRSLTADALAESVIDA